MAKHTKAEEAEALADLRKRVKPGDTIFCVLRHVSRSGMMRVISFYEQRTDKELRMIDYSMGILLDHTRVPRGDGLRVGGCGMDMGFHMVYNLGRTLFPKGGSLKHSPRRLQEERSGRTKETDGGYLLKYRWL